jgi:hypothetical protein
MTLSHKKDGKLRGPIFSVEVKSKWKTYWLLCFEGLTTRKLKEKKCAQNTHSSIVWFCSLRMLYIVVCLCNFWTPHNIVRFCTFWMLQLWKATFGVFEIRRKKKTTTMIQIKRWSEKACCHEWRGVTRK